MFGSHACPHGGSSEHRQALSWALDEGTVRTSLMRGDVVYGGVCVCM